MNTIRRKLAIATWAPAREGNIFGKVTIDASHALAYVDYLRRATGEKVTINHLVGKAIAVALRQTPSVNGRILFDTYIPHKTVDIAFLVALEEGADLGKAKVERADEKATVDIARELRQLAERLRAGKDTDYEKSKGLLRILPVFLLRPIVWLTGFITGALGWSAKPLGLEAFPFGSCVITNIGVFGLDEGYAPFTPFARVPVLVTVGAVVDRPTVHNGQVLIRKQITLCATIDHRFLDGAQGATLVKRFRAGMDAPWTLDGAQSPPEELGVV